jgi:hypothetical protein
VSASEFDDAPATRIPDSSCPYGPVGDPCSRKLRFAVDSPVEGDGFEPSVPVKRLTQTRSNGDVQHPCAASGMAIGTEIGFAIGGFAAVVAAADEDEGPNAWVPVALLNSAICVVASRRRRVGGDERDAECAGACAHRVYGQRRFEDVRKMVAERERRLHEEAPTTAAAAATFILDGVKADQWRILVGGRRAPARRSGPPLAGASP